MKLNKMFNGTANVLVKSKIERELLGKKYEQDDIIAYLEKVEVVLAYNEIVQGATQEGNILAVRADAFPSTLYVSNIANNSALEKLLYTPTEDTTEFTFVNSFYVDELDNGLGYLTINIDDEISSLKVKSYNEKGQKIAAQVSLEEETIVFEDISGSERITAFITATVKSQSLALTKKSSGYYELEIQLEGKKGDEHGYFVLTIPAAEIISSPQYEYGSSNMTYANQLIFTIVKRSENPKLSFVRV